MNLKLLVVLFLSAILLSSFLTMNPSEKKEEKIPMLRNYYTPDHYPSFQEINHTLHQIAKEHPDIAKVFSIGHTWGWDPATGKYDWPKPLWTIKISDNPDVNESEPRVYIHWHHAREWIDPAFMMYLINNLINGYYTNDTIHWLVNHYEIYITPLSNADGYVIDGNGNLNNLTGGWGPGGWRKNARDNNGDGTLEISDQWGASGEGVDPERNWDWHWSEGDNDPNSSTYHGPYPFSEPMVIAEKNFIENYSIDAQCVLHSFSGAILIPWFYTSEAAPHDAFYRDFAKHMALRTKINGDSTKHYDYGRPDEVIGYSAPGGSSDWVYGDLNKIGIAVEMEPQDASWSDDGFHPSTDKIQMYSEDLYEAMIYFIEISDTRLKSKSNAGEQPNAYVVWGYVKDDGGNPVAGEKVTITNSGNGEEIETTTDEYGFYMLDLGTLNSSYSSTTQFQISAGSAIKIFHANNSMGSEKIDIVESDVPEFSTAPGLLIIATLAIVIYFSRH